MFRQFSECFLWLFQYNFSLDETLFVEREREMNVVKFSGILCFDFWLGDGDINIENKQ